jgi:hypothetical protein
VLDDAIEEDYSHCRRNTNLGLKVAGSHLLGIANQANQLLAENSGQEQLHFVYAARLQPVDDEHFERLPQLMNERNRY